MEGRSFDDLLRLLRAEIEMLRAHVDAFDEVEAAAAELVATGGSWGGRLEDALATLRTYEEWKAKYPTVEWWKPSG
jgi:hypothetical protein